MADDDLTEDELTESNIGPEFKKEIELKMNSVKGDLPQPEYDQVNINQLRNSPFGPPAVQYQFRKHQHDTKDPKEGLDEVVYGLYGNNKITQNPDFKILVAAKAAYILNTSLQALMSSERSGGNPELEGRLQQLLSMQGITDGLAGDILYGLQDFPAELRHQLRLEQQGKNPEGENEFNEYCQKIGIDNNHSAMDKAREMQTLPDDQRKQQMLDVYREHYQQKAKVGASRGGGR